MTAALQRTDTQTSNSTISLEIENFYIETAEAEDRDVLNAASIFIRGRHKTKSRLGAAMVKATIEEGLAFERVYEICRDMKMSWERWVQDYTPYDPDTARHYRNLATNLAEAIAKQPDSVFESIDMGALYKLSVNGVRPESVQRFFEAVKLNQLTTGTNEKGDVALAEICREPEVLDRMENGEINKRQALSLVRAFRRVEPIIADLAKAQRVSEGDVVIWLNERWLDYARTPDHSRSKKTWHDLKTNDYNLVSGERVVHISTASFADCQLYMRYRSEEHRDKALVLRDERERITATARIQRGKDGKRSLTLLDDTALPPDLDGDVLVEFILKPLPKEPAS